MIIKKFINGKMVDVNMPSSPNPQITSNVTLSQQQQTSNSSPQPTPQPINTQPPSVPRKSGGCGCGRKK